MQLASRGDTWHSLNQLASRYRQYHLRDLMVQSQRFESLHWRSGDLLLDLSKQRWTPEVLDGLLALAEERQLPQAIADLVSGVAVNTTEQRPALHTALRQPTNRPLTLDGQCLTDEVEQSLQQMAVLVERLHAGQWRGATGHPITDVVNLGVGGSDLGPLMATHALADFRPSDIKPLQLHFASTMDGSQLAERLDKLNPATTLFIISSKSFSTPDTLSNAATALHWLTQHLPSETLVRRHHFIGVSAQPDKMSAWGIDPQHQLTFWDWVGGRFSLWSVIGLPIALQIGMAGFRQLLAGAHAMDQHFTQTPLAQNLPVLLGLAGIWNINFLNIRAQAILPYDGRLKYLPAYLTQLEMESNGKRTTHEGEVVDYPTCPVLWGELGPNAQHAFYQLLHQGTEGVNSDFIAPLQRYSEVSDPNTRAAFQQQHRMTLANCFAQSRLLMLGDAALKNLDQRLRPPHKLYQGNQPSTTLLLDQLTPQSLGQLIALYEHKVYVQAVIWGINPFDQWGVELGKQIAVTMEEALSSPTASNEDWDPSTRGLLEACLTQEPSREARD